MQTNKSKSLRRTLMGFAAAGMLFAGAGCTTTRYVDSNGKTIYENTKFDAEKTATVLNATGNFLHGAGSAVAASANVVAAARGHCTGGWGWNWGWFSQPVVVSRPVVVQQPVVIQPTVPVVTPAVIYGHGHYRW